MTEPTTADKTLNKLREWSREINRGFLEFWVLTLLRRQSLYGARICSLMEDLTEGHIQLEPGTIYPLLNRLARMGWIAPEPIQRREGRGPLPRYYRLTKEGERLLDAMIEHYFAAFNGLLRLMAEDFRSVRERLKHLLEEVS